MIALAVTHINVGYPQQGTMHDLRWLIPWFPWFLRPEAAHPKKSVQSLSIVFQFHGYLVGGLDHFLFSHILGIIIPVD